MVDSAHFSGESVICGVHQVSEIISCRQVVGDAVGWAYAAQLYSHSEAMEAVAIDSIVVT